jgi:hypothetical protein
MVVSMSKYDDEPRVCKACADANDPAKLRAELASMRASRDALVGALNRLCACVADVNEDRLCEMANDKSEPKLAEEAAAVLQARAALAVAKKGKAS